MTGNPTQRCKMAHGRMGLTHVSSVFPDNPGSSVGSAVPGKHHSCGDSVRSSGKVTAPLAPAKEGRGADNRGRVPASASAAQRPAWAKGANERSASGRSPTAPPASGPTGGAQEVEDDGGLAAPRRVLELAKEARRAEPGLPSRPNSPPGPERSKPRLASRRSRPRSRPRSHRSPACRTRSSPWLRTPPGRRGGSSRSLAGPARAGAETRGNERGQGPGPPSDSVLDPPSHP